MAQVNYIFGSTGSGKSWFSFYQATVLSLVEGKKVKLISFDYDKVWAESMVNKIAHYLYHTETHMRSFEDFMAWIQKDNNWEKAFNKDIINSSDEAIVFLCPPFSTWEKDPLLAINHVLSLCNETEQDVLVIDDLGIYLNGLVNAKSASILISNYAKAEEIYFTMQTRRNPLNLTWESYVTDGFKEVRETAKFFKLKKENGEIEVEVV